MCGKIKHAHYNGQYIGELRRGDLRWRKLSLGVCKSCRARGRKSGGGDGGAV